MSLWFLYFSPFAYYTLSSLFTNHHFHGHSVQPCFSAEQLVEIYELQMLRFLQRLFVARVTITCHFPLDFLLRSQPISIPDNILHPLKIMCLSNKSWLAQKYWTDCYTYLLKYHVKSRCLQQYDILQNKTKVLELYEWIKILLNVPYDIHNVFVIDTCRGGASEFGEWF